MGLLEGGAGLLSSRLGRNASKCFIEIDPNLSSPWDARVTPHLVPSRPAGSIAGNSVSSCQFVKTPQKR